LSDAIIADILTDGHLGSNMIIYTSINNQELLDFSKRTTDLFGTICHIKDIPTSPAKMAVIFDRNLMNILHLCGIPIGQKVLAKYDVPNWIKKSSNDTKSEFLRRMFSNDGCVTFNGKRIKVKITQYKEEHILESGISFMNSLRDLLSQFDIKSTNVCASGISLRKDGLKTIGMQFEIHGTRKNLTNIEKYSRFISFSNDSKRVKLQNYISKLQPPKPL
jgi:intein/homing endonuclease